MNTPQTPLLAPRYAPPVIQRAVVAAGLAPLLVLAVFFAVLSRLLAVDTGLAALLACSVWVCVEMQAHQHTLGHYNAQFVQRHLAWRSSASLAALAADTQLDAGTRGFIQRHLDAGRQLRPDGPDLPLVG